MKTLFLSESEVFYLLAVLKDEELKFFANLAKTDPCDRDPFKELITIQLKLKHNISKDVELLS